MTRISGCLMLVALACAAPAQALPIINLLPPTTITAAPGETVGWGYEIINDDPNYWVVIAGLVPDPFAHGTGSDAIFGFPVLAPAASPGFSVIQPYVPGVAGLYEFTWDLTAPAGFVNSGFFHFEAQLYDGDPFQGASLVATLPDLTVAYNVAVASASVPEPATLFIFSAGLGCVGVSRLVSRRRRRFL
jgi:hypothetical protein